MATIGTLKTPVKAGVGGCIPCGWDFDSGGSRAICPANLSVGISYSPVAFKCPALAVNFAGRGKVGDVCGGSDSYMGAIYSIAGGAVQRVVDIDVWRAYRDGVWTSSVTILLYAAADFPSVNDRIIFGVYGTPYIIGGNKLVSFDASTCASPICPTTLLATVTLLDDGTITIS